MKQKAPIRIKDYEELIKRFKTPLRWDKEYLYIDKPLNSYVEFQQLQKLFRVLLETGRCRGIDVCAGLILRKARKQKRVSK